MKLAIGIDIGSSSIKGAILDLERSRLSETRSRPFPVPQSGQPPRHFVLPIEMIVEQVLALIMELLSLDLEANVQQLFFSSQMGGVVIHASSSEQSSMYISWRDERATEKRAHGDSYVDEVRSKLGESCLESLGNELKPGSTLALLYWLTQNHQIDRNSIWSLVGSCVISALIEEPPTVHLSEGIGVWDLATKDWNREAFERLELGLPLLPNHTRTFQSIGTMKIGDRTLEVFPAVGDHPCSLLGVGVEAGELSVNVSTGSQVTLFSEQLRLGPWQTRFACLDGYLNTITHLPAGRALDGLFGLVHQFSSLPPADAWNRIRLAVEEDGNASDDLEVKLSFFDGPMGSYGEISNIRLDNLTIGALFRAAFRNMAENYLFFASRLDPQRSCSQVVLSGGLTQRFPYLRQQIGQRLGKKVRETPEGDDALLGLLRLAKCVDQAAERRCV